MSDIFSDPLPLVAALNSTQANPLTLLLVQLFGEKRQRTDEKGTVTVARFRGKFYMLDYEPVTPPPGGKEETR